MSTSESTSEERTCWLTTGSAEPLTATPSAQATTRTAAVLRAGLAHGVERAGRLPGDLVADPGAGVLQRRLPERRAHEHHEQRTEETHSDDSASPSSCGASQMPTSPPSSRPAVAKAPEMKPCQ